MTPESAEAALNLQRVQVICQRANGVQPLRQVSAIPDGYQKNRSQIWRLSVLRAQAFSACGLIGFDHRPGRGVCGAGSTRTKSFVYPTVVGRAYVDLCRTAARQANLSWPEHPYGDLRDTGYVLWQEEWLQRRERFTEALRSLVTADAATQYDEFLAHGALAGAARI